MQARNMLKTNEKWNFFKKAGKKLGLNIKTRDPKLRVACFALRLLEYFLFILNFLLYLLILQVHRISL